MTTPDDFECVAILDNGKIRYVYLDARGNVMQPPPVEEAGPNGE